MKITPLIIILTLLTSCDPAKILIIRTSSNPNTSVTVYANKNILAMTNDSEPEKIIIRIPPTENSGKRDTTLYYGIGGWGNPELMPEFSKNIDSIIIINSKGKVDIDNRSEINEYLIRNRSGFAKRKLIIEAK